MIRPVAQPDTYISDSHCPTLDVLIISVFIYIFRAT